MPGSSVGCCEYTTEAGSGLFAGVAGEPGEGLIIVGESAE